MTSSIERAPASLVRPGLRIARVFVLVLAALLTPLGLLAQEPDHVPTSNAPTQLSASFDNNGAFLTAMTPARRAAARLSDGWLHTTSLGMSQAASKPQGSFPTRRKNVLIFGLVGAATGAVIGAVAPAEWCNSTTIINDGPVQCNDRGKTVAAFSLAFGLGGAVIGAFVR